ncbi:DUF6334 family protein [Dendronalium sp. ChiSLP03b]|uniref:DUF6334 family protein n=1 Tax=Dendronalium sp. ChiSLP03b TaxID=3075381 RepID=UPI002AD584AA|nr:DUF6334 family protein [Dendronalium sp. ChiSLP03b]MDZ8204791.1 DUF6334 family protein [Dendronalium sp. ChiSLP03b]
MVENEFPIGQTLTAVSIVEEEEFAGNELCLDEVKFFFQDTTVTLLPLTDTDEIEIIKESSDISSRDTPSWCNLFIGEKLMNVWVYENDQGYLDQVIFAFDSLHPSIAFVAEGSVIKVFVYDQLCKEKELAKTNYRAKSSLEVAVAGLIYGVRNIHGAELDEELINLLEKLEDKVLGKAGEAAPS